MEIAQRIGNRVKKLREERSWTQQMLAGKIDVSQSTIAGIENGSQLPGTALLGRIADLFSLNLDFFYRAKENPFEMLLRGEEVGPEYLSTLTPLVERCLRYREIENIAARDRPPTPQYPAPSKGGYIVRYAESVADQERRRLNVGFDLLPDLPRMLEEQGIRVMGIKVAAAVKLDGLFLCAAEEGCFILVNTSTSNPKERQLFTLAHEYGHILMHRDQGYRLDKDVFAPRKGDRIEMAANAFAAAFLMPSEAIRQIWGKKGHRDIAKIMCLRRWFGVSYRALGWRLHNLGLIAASDREGLESHEKDLKRKEELLYNGESRTCVEIPEFSDRQRLLAIEAFRSKEVSISKLAEWLEVDVITADLIAKEAMDWEETCVSDSD